MSEQEQYSHTDCIELVGLPNNIDGKVQENAVLKTFQLVEINIGRQNIHAVQTSRPASSDSENHKQT